MFGGKNDSKSDFLNSAKLERQQRQDSKKKETAIVKIQACVRMFVARQKFCAKIRSDFDLILHGTDKSNQAITALSLFKNGKKLLMVFKNSKDNERLLSLCRAIVISLDVGKEPKYWYMSILLMKDWTSSWIQHLKNLLVKCSEKLKDLKMYSRSSGSKEASVYLSMLVIFTDCTNWKILSMKGGENIKPIMRQLCVSVVSELTSKGMLVSLQEFLYNGLNRTEICLNQLTITAVTKLILRCFNLMPKNAATDLVLVRSFFTLPAYVHHLKRLSTEGMDLLLSFDAFEKTLNVLHDYQNMASIYNSLGVNECLCLIGNIVTLCSICENGFSDSKDKVKVVLIGLVKYCKTFVGRHHGNTQWHSIFGWCCIKNSRSVSDSSYHLLEQLQLLWKQPLVGYFFENLPSLTESEAVITSGSDESKGGILRRALMKTFRKSHTSLVDLKEPVVIDICMTCDLYQTVATTFTQLRLEIVAGLSLQEEILVRLWRFIYSLGPGAGMKSLLNYINGNTLSSPTPLSSLLILFCECSCQLIPILDDEELYEKQKPFHCTDLVKLSSFLNVLVFKLIWNNVGTVHKPETLESTSPGNTVHIKKKENASLGDDIVRNLSLQLLHLLYDRDCRRQFMEPQQWLVKDIKMSSFNNELKEKTDRSLTILQNVPHVIPHMERVKIFHRWIEADKLSLGIDKEYSRPTALVNVRRSRILEDGYEQLSRFTGSTLKGIIRIKFINEQGLDEAGIDQDGVFKEFLEDTITEAFNPQLNLFKLTMGGDEQRLYPSPTSFVHENHLNLFDFIGKMIGKALYEGILVDVPFASFFLNKMLTQRKSALYSSIDELPSLDPEMYKNLNFIKNYDGDVGDLELVFAYDEEILGQLVTHDLKPGGRAIPVTNSNKLAYVHLMAQYRLNTHIKEQSNAFIRGFLSVISPQWLGIFSGPELQRLISGDSESMDLHDLKSNTRYYGGYHGGHPTILWLWDIVINDFNTAEKKLFLKFVTSCSNPPLLGFGHLEPPFSVRFVDSAEDEDTGDTVGSVVRGLFGVRKRGSSQSAARLPSASTCFNLLKLPSYKKKSVLKEKLRYAINSGAGFELS